MSQQEQALHAVEVFREHANRQKSWPFIDADRLADGMAQRVKDPTNMVYHVGKGTIGPLPYQGGYGTCGPTAIVRDLIQDAPLEYVELTSMLFWTGECKLWHGKHAYPKPLRASYALRHYKPTAFVDPKLWNVADWILTATLRDSLNKNFQHEKFSPRMLAGTNFPQQMQAFRKLGYQKVESESNARIGPGAHGADRACSPQTLIEDANEKLRTGFHVNLWINATLLHSEKQDEPQGAPPVGGGWHGHWVELLTPIRPIAGCIEFDVFSWGRKYHIPRLVYKPLSLSVFETKFVGFVAAKY